MKFLKNNKGVIIFYLLLIITTLVFVENNERNLDMNSRYVYLTR